MIPLYYINLAEQPSRKEWFENQCAELGISTIRIDAVDGRKLPQVKLEEFKTKQRLRLRFGPAEIGCALSHRKVWEAFCKSGEQWCFVAEDDLHLAKDSAAFFQSTFWIPKDASLVKAESTFKKCHLGPAEPIFDGERTIRRLLSLHGGAGGYFINQDAAQKALEATTHRFEPADHVLFNPEFGFFEDISAYQIAPAFGAQDLFFENSIDGFIKSGLELERQTLRKRPAVSKILRELKRPFRQGLEAASNAIYTAVRKSSFVSVPYFSAEPGSKPEILRKRFK
ncbi:glycosyltransferase family 25 protein [Parasedimentitalea huanghaiensis]|uniref:glycosyltransferase family 25 protein n=1 Tax=Parasedimentitalea huanghaiensis TaxID=2682100 RepID=UPI00315929C7